MPYVNVRVTAGISTDECRQLVSEITDSLERILGKSPEYTHVVIDEVDVERWGLSGMLTSELWKDVQQGR